MIYCENSKMIIKLIFFFTVLSIIGNSHKGVQCIESELLNKYIKFNSSTLDSYNRICFFEFYNHVANLSIDTELDSLAIEKLQNYYIGLIRVINVGVPEFKKFVYSAMTFFKMLMAWHPSPAKTRIMVSESNQMITKGKECNLWQINTCLKNKEDRVPCFKFIYSAIRYLNISTGDSSNNTERFNQCTNIFNLLTTPTKNIIKLLQEISLKDLEFEDPGQIDFVPIALRYGHILLLLKDEEEEMLFTNLTEEIQTSYIVFLMMETVGNIFHAMIQVLEDLSINNNDVNDVKVKLLRSMYETVVDTANAVNISASIHRNSALRSRKEAISDKNDKWQFEISYFDDFFATYEKFHGHFIIKLGHYENRILGHLKYTTKVFGEGRLCVIDDNGQTINVRISMFEYYHISTKDINKVQGTIEGTIINNRGVHLLLELNLWLSTVYQFANQMVNYYVNQGNVENTDDF